LVQVKEVIDSSDFDDFERRLLEQLSDSVQVPVRAFCIEEIKMLPPNDENAITCIARNQAIFEQQYQIEAAKKKTIEDEFESRVAKAEEMLTFKVSLSGTVKGFGKVKDRNFSSEEHFIDAPIVTKSEFEPTIFLESQDSSITPLIELVDKSVNNQGTSDSLPVNEIIPPSHFVSADVESLEDEARIIQEVLSFIIKTALLGAGINDSSEGPLKDEVEVDLTVVASANESEESLGNPNISSDSFAEATIVKSISSSSFRGFMKPMTKPNFDPYTPKMPEIMKMGLPNIDALKNDPNYWLGKELRQLTEERARKQRISKLKQIRVDQGFGGKLKELELKQRELLEDAIDYIQPVADVVLPVVVALSRKALRGLRKLNPFRKEAIIEELPG